MNTKDDVMETMELIPLQCFHEVVTNHVQGGKNLQRCLLPCYTTSNKVIPDIDVVSLFATWSYAIILQFYGALIILIYDVVLDLVSMIL